MGTSQVVHGNVTCRIGGRAQLGLERALCEMVEHQIGD